MIKLIRSWFKPKAQIRFRMVNGGYHVMTPVVPARSVLPYWLAKQVRDKNVKFVRCPGMHDMSQQGYLITAWTDIHIKANGQGMMVDMPVLHDNSLKPQSMDFGVVDGLAPIREGVEKHVIKLPGPWGIWTAKGYSAYVLPAVSHSPFLDRLHVYGGIVDYEKFHTVNFIFSALTPCEFVIPMGTPLLQVIPFKNEPYHAIVGKATPDERDQHEFSFKTRVTGAYRRLFHQKKTFTIEDQ